MVLAFFTSGYNVVTIVFEGSGEFKLCVTVLIVVIIIDASTKHELKLSFLYRNFSYLLYSTFYEHELNAAFSLPVSSIEYRVASTT